MILRRGLLFVLLSLTLIASVGARVVPRDPRLDDVKQFLPTATVDHGDNQGIVGQSQAGRNSATPLGVASPHTVNSRGAAIATTWRDWISNGSINRTVAANPPGNNFGPAVQFSFMYKASRYTADRTRWGYVAYDAVAGAIASDAEIVQWNDPLSKEAGLFPKIVVDPLTGSAYIAGYDFPNQVDSADYSQLHVVFDALPLSATFGGITGGQRIPDSVTHQGNYGPASDPVSWPAFAMTTAPNDTVMYLFAFENAGTGQPGAAKVFRRDGSVAPSTGAFNPDIHWTLVFSDTAEFPNLDIAASSFGTKIAAAWIKSTPAGAGNTRDGDVWYADSPHGLAGTWTRHCVTNYSGDGYRANIEVSALYDSADKLHLVWNASVFTSGIAYRRGRIFHWSEYNPSSIYTVYNGEWDVNSVCGSGGNNMMTTGSISIGECDSRLYTIFSAFNDPGLGSSGTDCAATGQAPATSSANGEIYVTISKDLQGRSWDKPRNLTNSETPGCDTTGNCADDRWGCISTRGIDVAVQGGNWTAADIAATYDPTGSYAGTSYTNIWYLQDHFPGGGSATPAEGPMTLNDYRWIRLACVQPVIAARLAVSPGFITYPTFGHTSTPKNVTLTLENTGNTSMNLITTPTIVADSCKGPGCGPTSWLTIANIPTGLNESSQGTATLILNKSGVITSGPTVLWGKAIISYGPPSQADTIRVQYTVADTIQGFVFDSISTSCAIKLAVANNGEAGCLPFGHSLSAYPALANGNVNMNFRPPVECDTGSASPYVSRGDASVYLADASPVVVRKVGAAPARLSYAVYGSSPAGPNGFKPLPVPAPAKFDTTIYQRYYSSQFLTVDSMVKIQKWWYAPKTGNDSCQFIVEKTMVMPNPIGTSVTNLQIGEAFDWDVPSDSNGVANISGYDSQRRMIWTQGFNSADTVTDCCDNSLRFAGSALFYTHLKASCGKPDTTLYGGYSVANDSFVYPSGGFVPEQTWTNMKNAGYAIEPRITDVHTVLTFKGGASGYTLPANDTLTIYTGMAVTRTAINSAAGLDSLKRYIDKARKFADFYLHKCACCGPCDCGTPKRGDVNMNSTINLADASALVSYLTGGGYVPPCLFPESDVNGDNSVNLADLAILVSYLTGGADVRHTCP